MDQAKVGKFISQCRKEKGMTQAQKERLKKITTLGKFTFYFYNLVGLLGIACAIFQANLFMRIVCAILVVSAIILLLEASRCPNCGKYGVNTNPHSQKFGTCKYCENSDKR